MDPNSTLKKMIILANRLLAVNEEHEGDELVEDAEDALVLSELVLELNAWIVKNGTLPDKWGDAVWDNRE